MAEQRPTPALTRKANVKNLKAGVAAYVAVQQAARKAGAAAAAAKAASTTTAPHPGIPPMTTTAKGKAK